MGHICLFFSLITGFVIVYDLYFALVTNLLLIVGLYLISKTQINAKMKAAFYVSLSMLPFTMYSIYLSKNIYVTDILKMILFFFVFKAFAEMSVNPKIRRMAYVSLILAIFHVLGIMVMSRFVFLPPQFTSKMTVLFVTIGVFISILGAVIVRKTSKVFSNG